jgi:hypothetical protein
MPYGTSAGKLLPYFEALRTIDGTDAVLARQ